MFLSSKNVLGNTILNEKVNSHNYYANLHSDRFKNPYKETLPIKFPKNKHRMRKPTYMTTITQTTQSIEKPCVRLFEQANRSIVFENPENHKKLKGYGQFHSHSLQSRPNPALNRSFEDIGAKNNKRHLVKQARKNKDPILVGQSQKLVKNSNYIKIWADQKKHIHHGIKTRENFNWPIKKDKQKLYCFVNKDQKIPAFKI